MKKVLSVLLLLILAITVSISLVACGDDGTDDGTNGAADGSTSGDNNSAMPDGAMHELDYELSEDSSYYIVSGWGVHFAQEIVVPATHEGKPVKEIKDNCFNNKVDPQTRMTKITLPDTIERIGTQAFKGCKALTSVTFGSGIKEIAEGAFAECTALTSISLNEGLTTIGSMAFASCTSLTSITLPTTLTSIGMAAFDGSAYATNESNARNGIVFVRVRDNTSWAVAVYNYDIMYATVYSNVRNTVGIADGTFIGCDRVDTIILPDTMKYIGKNAFEGCPIRDGLYCDETTWQNIDLAAGNSALNSLYKGPWVE